MLSSGFESVVERVSDLAESTADRAVSRAVGEFLDLAPEIVVDVLDALTVIA